MNQRELGRTGIKVSEVSFGGVEIGLPYGIGVNSRDDMLSDSEAINLLHAAVDHGINFFDTARMYGASETLVGRAFQNKRDQVVICSKCRHFRNDHGNLPDTRQLQNIVETSLQESLAALNTDYIDVYMLHQADVQILDNDAIAETFLKKKQQGILRATGVSTYAVEETEKAIRSGVWDVIQLPFNLMNQSHEANFLLAAKHGVGIIARSVLCKGVLSERGRYLHSALQDVEAHIQNYRELLTESTPDLPTLAIKFALSFKQVSSVLVGIDRMSYMHTALAAANSEQLDELTLAQARELCYPDPQFLDLAKWDRMGWLK